MLGSLFHSSIPDEALEFAGFVLVHCALIADSNRDGELICPFAILEGDDGTQVVDFESETQQEAVSKGWASLAEAQSKKVSWGFGREGIYREPDGNGTDALTVTVWISGMQDHYSVVQRFGRRQDQALYLIGAPDVLMHEGNHAEPVQRWNAEALERGVAQHRKGTRWSAWRGE